MNLKKITLRKPGLDEIIEKIETYAIRRGFHFRSKSEENVNTYYIIDKKPESAAIISSLELLVGLSRLPERLRLTLIFEEKKDAVEVKIGYEVIMRQFDIVNTRASKRDLRRGEIFQDSFNQYILTLENKKDHTTKSIG